MYTENKNNSCRKAWETLRRSFLHKDRGEHLYRGWLCAQCVCAYVDLTLESDIHFLRFPVAIRPAGQLNNGLFLSCFQLNSCAQVCVCVCMCVWTGQAHSNMHSYTTGARLPSGRLLNDSFDGNHTVQAEGWKRTHPPDVLICSDERTVVWLFPLYLLQQFVSFHLQQRGEIVTVCRDLSTSSFLLLQFSDHLLRTQTKNDHIIKYSTWKKWLTQTQQ